MLKSANIFTSKNAQKFNCEKCDFICCKKSDYDRHLLTAKHLKANNANAVNADKYTCSICSGIFNHASSLSRHKKKCIEHNNLNIFKYILDKIKYDLSMNFTPIELMNMSIVNNRLNFMKHVKDIFIVQLSDITYIYDLVKKYKINKDKNIRECIEWLLQIGRYILQEDIEIQLIYLGFDI